MPERVLSILDADYQQWIVSLKKRYRQSQLKAAPKVNAELVSFYWSLGRDIAMMKPEEKWGQGFYDTLSRDLRQSLPDAKGFSYRNLHYMRQFYDLFPFLENMQQAVARIGQKVISVENEIAQQAVAQTESGITPQLAAQIVSIPWGHICLIMNRCGKDQDRYALESSSQPLGISSYELSNLIPERFQGDLPTIEEIENELNKK